MNPTNHSLHPKGTHAVFQWDEQKDQTAFPKCFLGMYKVALLKTKLNTVNKFGKHWVKQNLNVSAFLKCGISQSLYFPNVPLPIIIEQFREHHSGIIVFLFIIYHWFCLKEMLVCLSFSNLICMLGPSHSPLVIHLFPPTYFNYSLGMAEFWIFPWLTSLPFLLPFHTALLPTSKVNIHYKHCPSLYHFFMPWLELTFKYAMMYCSLVHIYINIQSIENMTLRITLRWQKRKLKGSGALRALWSCHTRTCDLQTSFTWQK